MSSRQYSRSGSGGAGKSYSGKAYDRWAYEQATPGSNDTPLNKLQKKFWITKQAVVRKFGKDEDEHIVASDSELDAKLELFRSINETTSGLQRWIEHYQDRLCNLSYEENSMGRFLKEYGKADKTKAGKMMVAVGKTTSYSGQQRLAIRVPLVRLYQEVETFRQRAIEDTFWTVKSMEKARTEYRGALMWMKNVSQELDPDTYKQLEKFRKVQGHVKQSKQRFDKLKLDVLQKVDLLAASRCNMFSHALIMYQNALITFWTKTSKTMSHVNKSFEGYQHYEFSYIKDLAEPSRQLSEDTSNKLKKAATTKEQQQKDNKEEGSATAGQGPQEQKDERFFFDPDYTDESAAAGNQSDLFGGAAGANNPGGLHANDYDDALLNFGDDDEAAAQELDDKALADLSMLTPAAPLERPKDGDDALLLQELMNPEDSSNTQGSGFSAQWNQMFGNQPTMAQQPQSLPQPQQQTHPSAAAAASASNNPEEEFSQFISAVGQPNSSATAGSSTSSSMLSPQVSEQNSFLPSQLFDLNQSLYSSHREQGVANQLKDFPMPSPARPAAVQKQLKQQQQQKAASSLPGADKADMSQWFSLFADLDPLANPDAIGKTTKEEDKNCYS